MDTFAFEMKLEVRKYTIQVGLKASVNSLEELQGDLVCHEGHSKWEIEFETWDFSPPVKVTWFRCTVCDEYIELRSYWLKREYSPFREEWEYNTSYDLDTTSRRYSKKYNNYVLEKLKKILTQTQYDKVKALLRLQQK